MKISLPKLTSLLFFLLAFHCMLAQHFQPVWNTPFSPMNIYVTGAQLYELDLQAGDEIGVFDVDQANNEYCVGAVVLSQPATPDNYALIICSMDDGSNPNNPNGFNPGNEFIFKFWASEIEIDEVEYTFPYPEYDEVFTALGTAAVELSASANNCLLSINPDQYDFGDVITGNCSGTESFTITNSGSSSAIVSISLGGTHANQFVLNSSGTYSIPSGGTKTVTVDFCPSSLGDKSATLVINGSGACNDIDVPLSGIGIQEACILSVDPDEYNFGDVITGDCSGTELFTITNSGSSSATVSISLSGTHANQFLLTGGGTYSIPSGGTKTVTVDFCPTSLGNKSAALVVNGSGSCNDIDVPLSGTGIQEACILNVDPDQHNFGEVITGNCSDTESFTITNSGSSSAVISISLGGTHANQFLLTGGGTYSIPSAGTKTVTVDFCPSSLGAKSATLVVNGSGSCNDIDVPLSGTGIQEACILSVDPDQHHFGEVITGNCSGTESFTITNSGSSSAVVSISLSGSHANQFLLTGGGTYSIPSGGTKTVTVDFCPSSLGDKSATLVVNGSGPCNDLSVTLTGIGVSEGQYFQPVWNTPFNPMNIYVTEALLNELDLQAGDEIGVFDVDQSNNEVCVGAVVLSQPVSPDNYALIICSMDDGANPDNPNGFTPGNPFIFRFYVGGLEINEVEYTFPYPEYDEVFTALGTAAVELSASSNNCLINVEPDEYNFGEVVTGDCSGEVIFTITNSGNSTATGQISITGADPGEFNSADLGDFTIQAGQSEQVSVEFCPTSVNEKTAILLVDGYSSCNDVEVNLIGNGTISQTINLPAGWTGISSFLQPFDANIEDVLIDISENLEMISNLNSFYQPGEENSDLNSWDYKSGYFIKVSEGVELTIKGVNPENKTVNLTSGWNLIPVLSDENVPIEGIFENQISNVEILKEAAGTNVWWPELNIFMINELIPGKSYLVKVNQDINITFQETYGFSCGDILTDPRDGQQYETVQIGDQCWMAENLAFLPIVSPSNEGSNTEQYYYVNGYQGGNPDEAITTDNYQNYGVLYNFNAAISACPENWHLPNKEEWSWLSEYLGIEVGGKLKSTATSPDPHPRWNFPNLAVTNSSGFSGYPGGRRTSYGDYSILGSDGYFWSSTESSTINAWYYNLNYNIYYLFYSNYDKSNGLSIRCLYDE